MPRCWGNSQWCSTFRLGSSSDGSKTPTLQGHPLCMRSNNQSAAGLARALALLLRGPTKLRYLPVCHPPEPLGRQQVTLVVVRLQSRQRHLGALHRERERNRLVLRAGQPVQAPRVLMAGCLRHPLGLTAVPGDESGSQIFLATKIVLMVVGTVLGTEYVFEYHSSSPALKLQTPDRCRRGHSG